MWRHLQMYSAADAENIEYTYLKHYTVSQKNCSFLFLSELRQISINLYRFWYIGGCIFHSTWPTSVHYLVKRGCAKFLLDLVSTWRVHTARRAHYPRTSILFHSSASKNTKLSLSRCQQLKTGNFLIVYFLKGSETFSQFVLNKNQLNIFHY